MRRAPFLLSLSLAACSVPQPASAPRELVELVGRVAGQPRSCLPISQTDGPRRSATDRQTLISGSGKTVWANDLGPSCSIGRDDILVFNPTGSSYCRGDIVRSLDGNSRIPGPTCVLGDFVPFTRP
ncbi:MAG TPA: hypothetical protein VIL42_00225 [Sphingomicrobium sp.]|jgi:hypothetical protein